MFFSIGVQCLLGLSGAFYAPVSPPSNPGNSMFYSSKDIVARMVLRCRAEILGLLLLAEEVGGCAIASGDIRNVWVALFRGVARD